MTGREQIIDSLGKAVKQISENIVDASSFAFEIQLKPSEKHENGDYATNVALRLASNLKKKPLDIAYEIKERLEKDHELLKIVEKVEVAPPGFINFFFSNTALVNTIHAIEENKKYGDSSSLEDKKIMVEFTDPNPFKEFHIGHLYSNIVGESIARLLESQGAQVMRACYQGDVGLHVAKALYGMMQMQSEMPNNDAPLSNRAQFMGAAYAKGATAYEEDAKIKEEINRLNKKIYERSDEEINKLYDLGRAWSLEYFGSLYKRLGTKFNKFYFESQVGQAGIELVREFQKKGVFEESEGAVIFPGKKHGLHNRVFINSLGLPTYEAKELGLAPTKYHDFEYDISVILTGNEINEYFKVLLKALGEVKPKLAEKTTHLSHGMVRLPSGKMSSRTGDVITGEWLMDEVVGKIHNEYPDMNDEVAEKVGMAAIKYAFLRVGVGQDIEFNIDESISLTGASGPYLQYVYVRTKSILGKAGGFKFNNTKQIELNEEEREIIRSLIYFPEIVKNSADYFAPSEIATYLFALAQKFNLFYQKVQILKTEDDNLRTFRLALVESVGEVIKNGLNLLGIETVDRM